jgi:hypothetical protein
MNRFGKRGVQRDTNNICLRAMAYYKFNQEEHFIFHPTL